jgi:hypothetical protein
MADAPVIKIGLAPLPPVIEPPVEPALAVDDAVTINFAELAGSILIDVLGNDTGTDLHITALGGLASPTTTTTHGAVSSPPNGPIYYTPTDGYCGTDEFTYTITDEADNTSTATVRVTIICPPMPTLSAHSVGVYTKATGVLTVTTTVTNTGSGAASDLAAATSPATASPVSIAWPAGGVAGALAPGESLTVTATYAVTAADLAAGFVTMTTTVAGHDPLGGAISAVSPIKVAVAAETIVTKDPPANTPPGGTNPPAKGGVPPAAKGKGRLAPTGAQGVQTALLLTVALVGSGTMALAAARRRRG